MRETQGTAQMLDIKKKERLQGWLTPEVLIFPSLLTQLPLMHLFVFFFSFLNFLSGVYSFKKITS